MKSRIISFNPPTGIAISGIDKSEFKIISDYLLKRKIPLYVLNSKSFSSNIPISEIFSGNPVENFELADKCQKRIFIISGITGRSADFFLDYLKMKNIKFDLKCVVTQISYKWGLNELYENILDEHKSMNGIK